MEEKGTNMSVGICLKMAAGSTAGLVFLLFLRLVSGNSRELILRQYEEFSGMLKERQRDSTWYQKTEAKLIKNGASFHFGRWINPSGYLMMQVLFALAGGFIIGAFAPVFGALEECFFSWGLIGFWYPSTKGTITGCFRRSS